MPRPTGDVTLRGDTDFRLWNSIDSSMSDAVIDYTGSFLASGSPTAQLLITDLDLINTLADTSYVEYATVTNSQRTGPGKNINAVDNSNVDNGLNDGWDFGMRLHNSSHPHTSDTVVLSRGDAVLTIRDSMQAHRSNRMVLETTTPPPQRDILIYRDLQIIDRQVCRPPSYPIKIVIPYDIPPGYVISLTKGTGFETGGHFGTQHFLRALGLTPDEWYGGSSPLDSPGPLYLQHAEVGTKVSRVYIQLYTLEPITVVEEKTDSTLPPVKVDEKRPRVLRRQ